MTVKYYYSPSLDSFYPADFKKEYVAANNWPTDLIDTHEDVFKEFSSQRDGLVRAVSPDGVLIWQPSVPSTEEITQQEIFWRNSELFRADIELYKVQDSDPKAGGSVSEWRNYRKSLRQWPEDVNFPNKEFRPKSPDFKE